MNSSADNIFSLAADIVINTSRSVFLTGKAGTGKTTFLHHIRKATDKNIIVAAPTGVAAINAGGITLHSLLQLPLEPFVPNGEGKMKLDYHLKLRKSKIEMLRELELLVIDEVSMLRADMLDAIDHVLRRYRNNQQPFGGVQMLFIGDLFQLPPVVQNQEWAVLKEYYASPFFFHAQALDNNMPLYIELKTVYRQNDQLFIDILNRIRYNRTTDEDLNILNAKYKPTFTPPPGNKYVTLCTHNYRADQINRAELGKLGGQTLSFRGGIKGNFVESSLPTEVDLELKVGAQIMFVKNDSGEQRRYYNGKLATVVALSADNILAQFDDGTKITLEKETWRNIRYVLNEESGNIEEEELGSFSQYPVRLAWAITIHKSQGLTFNQVIIDAGQAFAAGQVYVALSRCTSLEGIVLYSRITPQSIQTDAEALRFAKQESPQNELAAILERDKPDYIAKRLKTNFDWSPLIRSTRAFYELVQEKKIPQQEETLAVANTMYNKAKEQEAIANSFVDQLDRILYHQKKELLRERVCKASQYFHHEVLEHIAQPLADHIDELKNASRIKKYLTRAREIYATIEDFLKRLEEINYGNIRLTEGLYYDKVKTKTAVEPQQKEKPQRGDTKLVSLSLFREGKSLTEIAKERNLNVRTIEGHLAEFVKTGEVLAHELIDEATVEALSPLLEAYSLDSTLKPIKESVPEEYSYFDIKVVLNHLSKQKE